MKGTLDVCSRAQVTRAIYIGTACGPTHLALCVSWARRHPSTTLSSLSKNARSRHRKMAGRVFTLVIKTCQETHSDSLDKSVPSTALDKYVRCTVGDIRLRIA